MAILGQDPATSTLFTFSPILQMERRSDRRGGEQWVGSGGRDFRRFERPPEPKEPPRSHRNWREPAVPPRRSSSRGQHRERSQRSPLSLRGRSRRSPHSRREGSGWSPQSQRDGSRRSPLSRCKRSFSPPSSLEPKHDSKRAAKRLLVKSRPESPPVGLSLGRTTGVTAAGAWAARFEVASILESRCDPGELVRLIKSGKEGPHMLGMAQEPKLAEEESSAPPSWHKVEESREDSIQDLFSDQEEWDKEVDKQKAILASLAEQKELPPWADKKQVPEKASGSQSEKPRQLAVPALVPEGKMEHSFVKKATPPPASVVPVVAQAPPRANQSEKSEKTQGGDSEQVAFQKVAKPPPHQSPGKEDHSKRRRRGTAPTSMAQKESDALHKYNKDCIYVYEKFKKYGFEMDLTAMVEHGGTFDKERFRLLTRPNRAATGLNYVRLMDRYLRWRRERSDLGSKESPLDGRMGVLEFVEYMMQKQVGYLTPRSFLYAVDYFSSAFGFEHRGKFWNRAKRLALSFANSRLGPVSRAPCFFRATLVALEVAVTDPFLTKPVRVACGKLRLCIQASTRFDDVLNTPLSGCEWIRRPGEKEIIGLRSRAVRGKSGPRLWVASLKGASQKTDGWLQELMRLLLDSHGETWKKDDHMGKLATAGGAEFTKMPARLETDVSLVKSALEHYSKEGTDIGMKDEDIAVLRWHGAKATLSSIMQHLNLPKRVVRWQGNWSTQSEAMPDTYLRESQTLILESQEKCLEYLRQGGDLVRLVGEAVDPGKDQEYQKAEDTRRHGGRLRRCWRMG